MPDPLVLVPGLGCDARLFAPQIEVLSRRGPVTVLPSAQGERIEEIASQALPHLPAKFALAGHGFGGMVAMEMLRRAPDRVLRLALISTAPLADTPAEAAAREPRIIGAKAGRFDDAIAEEVPPGALAPGPDRAARLALFRQMARDLGVDAYVRQVRALQRRKDQQPVLRRCKAPVLVLAGAHDTLVPVKRQRQMAELIGQGGFTVIEEAGHLPSLEAPENVTDALSDWLVAPFVLR
ncbi:Putative aminoacrylate hydrolase RutD [Roseivivax jejudonensis]|uniref:Putative aminoacrylate hydrolase RutD n=1 Tax=Roseivivax jejudonensis TaxID=1529041 RepID=A0A1X6ZD33_9RHOB|nr:alpha/beta hydrolase [Roseivivax jejudonensis]SLN47382.1 Putative aminoacrylate hydrolase RutD [Roseivivax jejudonensis]